MMQKPIRSKRRQLYLALSTAAAAALLSLFVFLPQQEMPGEQPAPALSAVQVQALSDSAEAAETEGFGLYIDGVFIAACDERAEIDDCGFVNDVLQNQKTSPRLIKALM